MLRDVDAILMASGFSRRFGGADKLLAQVWDKGSRVSQKPLARYTLDLAIGLAAAPDPCIARVYFVAANDAVAALADGLPVTVIRNAHPELGQRETLRLGVTSSDAAFYLFFPCDQPFLDAATVRALVAARREGAIVQPRCCGEPSTPVIFSRAFRQEILGLNPGEHGRDLKTRHPEAVVPVDFDDPRLFMDVDTP